MDDLEKRIRAKKGTEDAVMGVIAVIAGSLFDYRGIDDALRAGGAFLFGYNLIDGIRYIGYRLKDRQ